MKSIPVWCAAIALCLCAAPAFAANGDCGIPVTAGDKPKSSDSLFILRAAVGLSDCAACVCDTDGNEHVSAGDALLDLRVAIGLSGTFSCGPCAEGSCPSLVRWTTHSGYGAPCTKSSDCGAGTCEQGTCRTGTELDLGWTGNGQRADVVDGSSLGAQISCPGTGGDCGACTITKIDTTRGSCRCANDSTRICDEPFATDNNDCPTCFAGAYVGMACTSNTDCDAGTCSRRCSNDPTIACAHNPDCGGGTCGAALQCSNGKSCNRDSDCTGTCTTGALCQCFEGPPQPLSIDGTGYCLTTMLAAPLSGTVDVDTGASRVVKTLKILDYSGAPSSPCPVCGGKCSNDPSATCRFDSECGGGTCVLDAVSGDGVRGGVCIGGGSNGRPCDVDARSTSLPVSVQGERGGGYSLDCSPANGPNATGTGARVTVVESTGTTVLASNLSCGGDFPDLSCPCLVCSSDPTVACSSDDDCAATGGTCSSSGGSPAPQPNACDGHLCTASGAEGQCTTGPDDLFCDDIVSASGRGLIPCTSNDDCSATGGSCSLVQRRSCFPATIEADGATSSKTPVLAAAFCMPAMASPARNALLGLPGPARIVRQARLDSFCPGAPATRYTPGVGGCP